MQVLEQLGLLTKYINILEKKFKQICVLVSGCNKLTVPLVQQFPVTCLPNE